jgi:hypothetical protein
VISEVQLDKAMNYLAETDVECAELRANVARSEFMAKVCEGLHYKSASGSVEDRKQEARTTQAVIDEWEKHFVAITKYETVRARRMRAELLVEVWRSQNANRRQAA